MHEKIGGEIGVAHSVAVADETNVVVDLQCAAQLLVGRVLGLPATTSWNGGGLPRYSGRASRHWTAAGADQSLEPIVHGAEQADDLDRGDVPAGAELLAPLEAVVLRKAVGIDGAADDAHGFVRNTQVLRENGRAP